MPNHVTTELTAPREVCYDLLTEGGVTFEKILPRPPEDDPQFTATAHHYEGGGTGYSMDGRNPMDWSRENWGTKWDAYSDDVTDEGETMLLRFDTAWAHPLPVIEELSRRHPSERIYVRYADEDLGSNLGEYVMQGGSIESAVALDDLPFEERADWAHRLKYGEPIDWADYA